MLLPTFLNNLCKQSLKVLLRQLQSSYIYCHHSFSLKKKKNLHTMPTSLDCNYEGILKRVSVLFMRANVTDPIMASTGAHKENRRTDNEMHLKIKALKTWVSLCSELHLLLFGLSLRGRNVYGSPQMGTWLCQNCFTRTSHSLMFNS